jgi:BTB/POZ domain-containing protein 9
MSHRYGFVDLETAISDYLKAILNNTNVCLIYDIANMYHLTSLCQVCKEFIDRNAQDILANETFLTLSPVNTYNILNFAQTDYIFCVLLKVFFVLCEILAKCIDMYEKY